MAVTDDMKAAINAIYNADVSAIQNLSDIAKRLQEGGLTVTGSLTITSELLLDHEGHKCHFFNHEGIAGIWYHKSGENPKVVRFDGGSSSDFSYGTEINAVKDRSTALEARCNALEARCNALEAKTQNITTNTNASQTMFKNDIYIQSGYSLHLGLNKESCIYFGDCTIHVSPAHAYTPIFKNSAIHYQM